MFHLFRRLINTFIDDNRIIGNCCTAGNFCSNLSGRICKKRKPPCESVIRITAETLSGIPSIVFGLFGMLFFVTALKWKMSLLAGAFTMVIMILPLIMRTSEEALKSVPDSYREASFGLGAGKLRTIFTIVLPSAVPGILAGADPGSRKSSW